MTLLSVSLAEGTEASGGWAKRDAGHHFLLFQSARQPCASLKSGSQKCMAQYPAMELFLEDVPVRKNKGDEVDRADYQSSLVASASLAIPRNRTAARHSVHSHLILLMI